MRSSVCGTTTRYEGRGQQLRAIRSVQNTVAVGGRHTTPAAIVFQHLIPSRADIIGEWLQTEAWFFAQAWVGIGSRQLASAVDYAQ